MPDTLQASMGPKNPQAMTLQVLPPDAGESEPNTNIENKPHRQHPPSRRTVASIQRVFTLIAIVNGLVLLYLVVAAIQLLMVSGARSAEIYVSLILTLLLVILAVISYQIITRRIVRPIARLVREASEIESGDRTSLLTIRSNDEISKLAQTFNMVLVKMRQALMDGEASNQQLLEANRQIEASINYAGLLQKSILPDRQLQDTFGSNHFILWLPRDTVGGDYYIFHSEGGHCLAGVADCAGHGVAGAMMTMLARAGIDRSIMEVGITSPAAILSCTDTAMRTLLHGAKTSKSIATSMDIGLARLDLESRTLRFAGAKISLYWTDGQTMHMLRGDHRAICDQRVGAYTDHDIPLLPDFTYYLTTDGLLDQSGGEDGFSLGTQQFKEWLIQLARQPLEHQRQALADALEEFRGRHPQRDDITILSFRFS
ncbi:MULTISPECIES: SpoIIE family protein phosphatase [unclassified Cyanobium]|uniref:SpoIIE family protein phosphatase n=1 Tax=unclassified Cyanobium TaxID=2627006 RepID=UPI0020CE9A1E|nr:MULTISPECIES: SpoIIE family protein phosphatase [unclassified Cyanobium]MCP9859137.1 SpoIIE family protein phosphatase [Cyanobium sp. Cruz-8H5]MCP9866259.1 SpoIIE family protein phosphatase [Cyanobium sp. Cruz-8D1]